MAHVHVHEEHPVAAVVMHYAHLISIIVLTITGLYIHGPWPGPRMEVMRQLHFWFMYILIITMIARVFWAIFGSGSSPHGSRKKIPDRRFFWIEKQNRGELIPTVRYYLYPVISWIPGLKNVGLKNHPPTSKFNPLQKITYVFWPFLIIAQAITGFAIYGPTRAWFEGLTYAVGGPMEMRVIHYLIMWLFVITTAIHIYLALAEDIGAFFLMFFWRETPEEAH